MTKTPKILNSHAKRRAEERYGIDLNKQARREIIKMIQTEADQAQFISRESNSRSLWQVTYNNQPLNIVYDKARSALATVLPTDAVEFQNVQCSVKTTRTDEITSELTALWKDWSDEG